MRKILSLSLSLLLLLSVGCSNKNTNNNKGEDESKAVESQTEKAESNKEKKQTTSIEPSKDANETSEQLSKTITPASPQAMRDITSMQLVTDMGIGWNLGNTLEACGDWINRSSISNYEVAWGMPITTKKIIDGIRDAGFKSVRIPVAWSNLMADDYTINRDLMDRVEEVVNYVLQDDMYAIVNIHWDNGWFAKFPTDYDGSMKKYKSIWTQISERFKNYSDYLIFESLNEEGGWNDIWNPWSGNTNGKAKSYGILNDINQEFVNIVRASGGNNAKRHLLLAGYNTNIDWTCDPEYKLPKDPANRIMVSVHYYSPPTFAILEEDADWGKAAKTWGTDAEVQQVKTDFEKMKKTFVDKGIPVIVGEYGSVQKNKDEESVRKYLSTVCETVYKMNMCPMLWDASSHYNRNTYTFNDSKLLEAFRKIGSSSR